MGKAKKRNFQTCINAGAIGALPSNLTRQKAIELAIKKFKGNNLDNDAKDLITLFGITAEELAEAGASYEDLLALKSVLF